MYLTQKYVKDVNPSIQMKAPESALLRALIGAMMKNTLHNNSCQLFNAETFGMLESIT
jgi:hypothetical protein